jgi:hypothetical protein
VDKEDEVDRRSILEWVNLDRKNRRYRWRNVWDRKNSPMEAQEDKMMLDRMLWDMTR